MIKINVETLYKLEYEATATNIEFKKDKDKILHLVDRIKCPLQKGQDITR